MYDYAILRAYNSLMQETANMKFADEMEVREYILRTSLGTMLAVHGHSADFMMNVYGFGACPKEYRDEHPQDAEDHFNMIAIEHPCGLGDDFHTAEPTLEWLYEGFCMALFDIIEGPRAEEFERLGNTHGLDLGYFTGGESPKELFWRGAAHHSQYIYGS